MLPSFRETSGGLRGGGRFRLACTGAAAVLTTLALAGVARAQTTQYFAGDGSILSASKYGASASGPFTSAFVSGNIIGFGVASGTGTGASVTVGGFNATESFTLSPSGTISNASNGVVPITVSTGKTLDFGSQSFTTSGTAGYIKNGPGVLALSGSTYGGGFTLNAGTVIARGVNAFGGNATPGALTINGGIIAANSSRDFSGKYSGITIGGNVQFGDTVGLASASANLTFSNNVALGTATRTLTIGANGIYTLTGAISGSLNVGLTVDAVTSTTGTLVLGDSTNKVNTFSGAFTVTNGAVNLASTGSLSSVSSITISNASKVTATTLGSSSFINSAATLAINNSGIFDVTGNTPTVASLSGSSSTATLKIGDFTSGTTTSGSFTVGDGTSTSYTGIITGTRAAAGAVFTRQGTGTLTLGGTNTYTGITNITAGGITLTNNAGLGANGANNGTVVSSGAVLALDGTAANLAVGVELLTLNGTGLMASPAGAFRNIAGTNSFAGAITLGSASTITASAGTLTLTGAITNGGFLLSVDGSGNTSISTTKITGAGGLTKNGLGTLTLSITNDYSGGTTVSAGTLALGHTTDTLSNTGAVVINGGTLDLGSNSDTVGAVTLSSGSINGSGTLTGSSYALQGGTVNAKLSAGAITVSTGTTTLGAAGRLNPASSLAVSSGQLTLGGAETVASYQQTGGTLAGSGTLTSAAAYDLQAGSVSAALGGSAALTKTTTGTVTLSGANNYSGGTTVSNGILTVTSGTLGATSGGLTVSAVNAVTSVVNLNVDQTVGGLAGTVPGTGTATINIAGARTLVTDQSGDTQYAGVLAGAGSFIKAGAGTLTFTGANIQTGGTTVNGGTLTVSGANATLGGSTGALTVNNPNTGAGTAVVVNLNTGVNTTVGSLSGTLATGTNTATINNGGTGTNFTVNQTVDGTYAGTIAGAGDLTVGSLSTKTLTLIGANPNFTGTTTVNAGTLAAGAAGALGSGTTVGTTAITVKNGGTLLLTSSATTDRVRDTATVSLGGTVSIAGTGTGATSYREGTAASTTDGGATRTGMSTDGLGALTLAANTATLDFGAGGVGTLVFGSFTSNNFTLNILNYTSTASGLNPLVSGVDGTDDRLIFKSTQTDLTAFSFNGVGASQIDLGDGYFEIVPVPEPGTVAAGLLALGTMGYSQRRRLRGFLDARRRAGLAVAA